MRSRRTGEPPPAPSGYRGVPSSRIDLDSLAGRETRLTGRVLRRIGSLGERRVAVRAVLAALAGAAFVAAVALATAGANGRAVAVLVTLGGVLAVVSASYSLAHRLKRR